MRLRGIIALLLLVVIGWWGASRADDYYLGAVAQPSAGGAIVFDNMTTNNTGGSSSTGLTNSHTIGAGANRVLYVGITVDTGSDQNPTCNFSGTSMTQVGEVIGSSTSQCLAVYRLVNPATGAGEVRVQWDSTQVGAVVSVSYSGVDQTTPEDGVQTSSGTSTSRSITVSSATDNLVLDWVAVNSNPALTPPGTGTIRVNENVGTSVGTMYGMSEVAGSASEVRTWSWTGAQRSSQVGFNLRKAP